jgi:hypothetical protein
MNMQDEEPEEISAQKAPKKDDAVALFILDAVAEGGEVLPRDVAQRIAAVRARPIDPKDLWRKYMLAVNQQAKHLARQGRIEIVRRGEAVDPDDVKGLFKLRLPK